MCTETMMIGEQLFWLGIGFQTTIAIETSHTVHVPPEALEAPLGNWNSLKLYQTRSSTSISSFGCILNFLFKPLIPLAITAAPITGITPL